jgi:hypothetical protein
MGVDGTIADRLRNLGLGGLMLDAGNNRLVLIAGAHLIAGALLVGIPVDALIALRFFSAGVLTGTAMLLITLRWTWFK